MPPGSPQPAITAAAAVSHCGGYRWWLERVWDPQRPRLLFLGLNPSSADAGRDDPTLRRLLAFARGWGYGGLEVLNLFSRRGSSPALLRRAADPVGSCTDRWIRRRLRVHLAAAPATVWLGWGNGGAWRGRDRAVLAQLEEALARAPAGGRSVVLGLTGAGHPRHPLYVPAAARLEDWPSPTSDRRARPS